MTIVTLRLPAVKASTVDRPRECVYCGSSLLQRWGGRVRNIRDTQVQQAVVYRYRCTDCERTFRHYPQGVTNAQQSQRLIQLAALCWVFGLSLRATTAILSAFPVALSHTSVWNDVQALAERLQGKLSRKVEVLGVDGVYPKLGGEKQPTVIAVDMGSGEPVAVAAINENNWQAVVAWLEPMIEELGVEVLVTDDLRQLAVAADRLQPEQQICNFHLLRWLWVALEKLRGELDEEYQQLVDEVWQIAKERPPGGQKRLFELWQAIPMNRVRDEEAPPLYRLRLVILRLHNNWEKYTLDQRREDVPATNNATERAIGKWRIRSRSTRGFKSWAGLKAAFLVCGSEII